MKPQEEDVFPIVSAMAYTIDRSSLLQDVADTAPAMDKQLSGRTVSDSFVPEELLVLDLEAARALLFTSRKKVGQVYDHALIIIEEVLPTILVRGHRVAKLGTGYLMDKFNWTHRQATSAKEMLRKRDIIRLHENSRMNKTVATWTINPKLVHTEERTFRRIWDLKYYWNDALGYDRADTLWSHCYENTDPRRTPRKLLITAHTLTEEDWAALEAASAMSSTNSEIFYTTK